MKYKNIAIPVAVSEILDRVIIDRKKNNPEDFGLTKSTLVSELIVKEGKRIK